MNNPPQPLKLKSSLGMLCLVVLFMFMLVCLFAYGTIYIYMNFIYKIVASFMIILFVYMLFEYVDLILNYKNYTVTIDVDGIYDYRRSKDVIPWRFIENMNEAYQSHVHFINLAIYDQSAPQIKPKGITALNWKFKRKSSKYELSIATFALKVDRRVMFDRIRAFWENSRNAGT